MLDTFPDLFGRDELASIGGGDAEFYRFGKVRFFIEKAAYRFLRQFVGTAAGAGGKRNQMRFLVRRELNYHALKLIQPVRESSSA